MALNAYQLISRVLPGRPFGDGRDGALTISSNTTQSLTARQCSGTAGTTSLSLASSGFTNGDVVLIHQARGTNAGSWEINMIVSGGGSTSLTLAQNLQTTYNYTGANKAQIIKVPMYTQITVNGGCTWRCTSWNQSTGGFLVFAATVGLTVNGALSVNGNLDSSPSSCTYCTPAGGIGGGFYGGRGDQVNNDGVGQGEGGEGYANDRQWSTSANGNGAGGAYYNGSPGGAAGGGGGNGTAGSTGQVGDSDVGGAGGSTAGNAELSALVFGGGGGAGTKEPAYTGGGGGSGAGAIIGFVKQLTTTTGYIYANGGAGAYSDAAGGGGAGGSILMQVGGYSIGTNHIQAYYGSGGGSPQSVGGNGGYGRIAIHYSGSNSGSTAYPSANVYFDGRLIEQLASVLFFI